MFRIRFEHRKKKLNKMYNYSEKKIIFCKLINLKKNYSYYEIEVDFGIPSKRKGTKQVTWKKEAKGVENLAFYTCDNDQH